MTSDGLAIYPLPISAAVGSAITIWTAGGARGMAMVVRRAVGGIPMTAWKAEYVVNRLMPQAGERTGR
jgi:hypothetical protein